MKKILILWMVLTGAFLQAQDAGFMDSLFEKKELTYGDCVKTFGYMYGLEVTDNNEGNIALLRSKVKYLPKKTPDAKLTVGDLSLLLMQYLKIESGLFYLASRSGRYASRELMIRNIIAPNTPEMRTVSGELFINTLRKAVEYAESR